MLFAIDHGNSAVKTTNFVFTSGLAEYPVKPPLQTDVLEWGGKFWALSGQRISFMRDKTRDDRFFILTLFAIAMELRKMGQLQPMLSVELAVGLPPEHYGTLRDKFANYFKRGSIQFVFNDTPICLMVQQVFVYPQAYAAWCPRPRSCARHLVPSWWILAAIRLTCCCSVPPDPICSSAGAWSLASLI